MKDFYVRVVSHSIVVVLLAVTFSPVRSRPSLSLVLIGRLFLYMHKHIDFLNFSLLLLDVS